jgi:hypothetical protein
MDLLRSCLVTNLSWLLLTGFSLAAPSGAGSSADWLRHREVVLKDTALVRYYTFEKTGQAAAEIPNLVGAGGALAFHANGAPNEGSAVPGRWLERPAVRMDRGYLAGVPFEKIEKAFSVTAWFRVQGQGTLRGDSVPLGGTLLSFGGGYWDGWRITYLYPERTLGFEIGRPQPASAVAVKAGAVASGVWHHLAATWDGKEMSLYVDGLPASHAAFVGRFTPPSPGGGFRIGFAGYGWGSVAADWDEAAVYLRAFSPAEVLLDACLHVPCPQTTLAQYERAEQAFARQEYAGAAADFAAVAVNREVPAGPAAAAHVRAGQALAAGGEFTAAAAQYAKALEIPALPEGFRFSVAVPLLQMCRQGAASVSRRAWEILLQTQVLSGGELVSGRLGLARLCRQEQDFAAAREQYRLALGMKEVTLRERLDLMLQLGHAAFEARDFAGARVEYARVVAEPAAPAHFRSCAALRIAQSYVAENKPAEAQAEYDRIAARKEYPEHHRTEAQECSRDLARERAGQPAGDPTKSRTRWAARPRAGVEFFVATDGADANPGSSTQPFATLERARDAVRALKQQAPLPAGGVTVTLRPGEYRRTQTFKLAAADSGTEQSPVVYRAENKGAVRVSGGARLEGFQSVTEERILSRLPAEARGKVLVADLKSKGINDFGRMSKRGFGATPAPLLEVFFNGKAMQLARWPNRGFVKTGKVVDPGPAGSGGGAVFTYEGDRPARWQQARDAWLFGYWHYLWADGSLPLASIDASARQMKTAQPYTYGGGVLPDMPYYVFNLLEEIDTPGEWYLDRGNGLLYFWPPEDPAQAAVEMSVLSGPLVEMDGVSHVVLEGLILELGRASGLTISGGTRCLVAGCVLRKLGGDGVVIEGGQGHALVGCDLHELGRGGARINGCDRRTLSPGGHVMENCHVHDFSRADRTYTPAVWMEGVGNRVAHNLFHDSPCSAIRLEGNDHVIEFNDIHRVLLETDDQGGLDMHFNPSYRGNVLRYNFWHDIGSGGVPCGQAGVRLDDAISGVLIYGNVFHRCSHGLFGGVQIHGGKDNIVDNNLFVECPWAVSFSLWSNDRWRTFLGEAARRGDLYTNALHVARYPALATLAENPYVNSVWRNLVYQCGGFLTRDRGIQDVMDNWITVRDPGFVDAARQNFAFRPALRSFPPSGFRPIPFAEIGLYESEHRASWPVLSRGMGKAPAAPGSQ